jgi:hypothetical protein
MAGALDNSRSRALVLNFMHAAVVFIFLRLARHCLRNNAHNQPKQVDFFSKNSFPL